MAAAQPADGADVTVRRAAAADADALANVAAATFRLACPPSVTEESMALFVRDVLSPERFEEYLADPVRALFLAERPGVPDALGYAMVVVGEPGDEDVRAVITHRPTAELSKIYVLPDAHGAGVVTRESRRPADRRLSPFTTMSSDAQVQAPFCWSQWQFGDWPARSMRAPCCTKLCVAESYLAMSDVSVK